MNSACPAPRSDNPDYNLLYRYVKYTGLIDGVNWDDNNLQTAKVMDFISPNVFAREVKEGRLEDYISVLHSNKKDHFSRIDQCFRWLGKRRRKRGRFPGEGVFKC
jgi:hypothetical protein